MKNLFVFDVEATSLYGLGFAVGAVVLNPDGELIDQFQLRVYDVGDVNDWVRENVLPHINSIPTTPNYYELREAFYQFYMKHYENAEVWVDCGFPVETKFLLECVTNAAVGADPWTDSRQWKMPYPLRDISTISGVEIEKHKLYPGYDTHNPLHDALVSAKWLWDYWNKKQRGITVDPEEKLPIGTPLEYRVVRDAFNDVLKNKESLWGCTQKFNKIAIDWHNEQNKKENQIPEFISTP